MTLVELNNLEQRLLEFARSRGWERFHSPKNLAMALTGEVGELVEIFQWMTEEESVLAAQSGEHRPEIEGELADVLIYLVRLATVLKVDLNAAVRAKLELNEFRFPALTENM